LEEKIAYLENKIKEKDYIIAYLAKGALIGSYEQFALFYNNILKLAKIMDLLFFINKLEKNKLSFNS
jgi:Tfp pilus assembly protein PilO